MEMKKSNVFNQNKKDVLPANTNYKIPDKIYLVRGLARSNVDVYMVKYKNYNIHSRGWFKGNRDFEILEEYSFEQKVKELDINDEMLFTCVLDFYQFIAKDIKINIIKEVDRLKNSNEKIFNAIDRLEIEYCLDFLTDYKYAISDIEDVEMFFKNALTAYKLELDYYVKNFDNNFNPSKYLNPFELLVERFGLNEEIVKKYNECELLTEVPEDLNSLNLCYDLENSKLFTYSFDATHNYPWKRPITSDYNCCNYYVVGFLPVKYLWKKFAEGNYCHLDQIENIVNGIAIQVRYLEPKDNNSDVLYNLDCYDGAYYDDDFIDKDKVVKLHKCYNNIKIGYYNGNSDNTEDYKNFVKILQDIIQNNKYLNNIKDNIETDNKCISILLKLVNPLIEGVI